MLANGIPRGVRPGDCDAFLQRSWIEMIQNRQKGIDISVDKRPRLSRVPRCMRMGSVTFATCCGTRYHWGLRMPPIRFFFDSKADEPQQESGS